MSSRLAPYLAIAVGTVVSVPGIVTAHGGGLSDAQPARLAVPTWLFLLTGGALIGFSFLLASFLTDRELMAHVHSWNRPFDWPRLRPALASTGRVVGLIGLAVVVVTGAFGPTEALRNGAVLIVWAGWWAGYTMTVYLLGDTWSAVNPFHPLVRPLGDGRFEYPDWLGTWPATAGLLLLIWIEVVSPLAAAPRLLVGAIIGYLLVTVIGVSLVGVGAWFRHVDPVAMVFRQYGKVAPLQREGRRVRCTLPGSALVSAPSADLSEVGFIVALVWGTTFDGFVRTPLWAGIAREIVGVGLPIVILYPSVLLGGYLLFLTTYWIAMRSVRRYAPTFLPSGTIARVFAPSLLAIAAGYHLAHNLNYLLALSPPLLNLLAQWAGVLAVMFVLAGHLLAIWVAHGTAHDRFPGRVQAIRSQYPVAVVMVCYTIVSLWIVTQPNAQPPYL